MMRYLLFLLLFVSLVCGAAVYMQTDSNGNVSYSDSPSPNAKQIDVPAPSTIQTAPAVTTKAKGGGDAASAGALGPTPHKPYTQFQITSPQDQQTFQNQRDIPVELDANPRLQRGDGIQLYVDGAKYRDPWFSQHAAIYLLDRGTHTIYAVLLDNTGAPLKQSNAVTIYIHYAALGGGGGGG
jgi:hypothetical protein